MCVVGVLTWHGSCAEKKERAPAPGSAAGSMAPTGSPRLAPRSVRRRSPDRQAAPDLRRPTWPTGYVLRKTIVIPVGQLTRIGQSLGGPLTLVTNYFLQKGTEPLQVNVIEAASGEVAARVYRRLRGRSFAGRQRYGRRGRFVVELVGGLPATHHRFMRAMKLLDRSRRRYRVTARYGLLKSGNAADVNVLFNLVLRPRPEDARWRARLSALKKTMRFDGALVLRTAPTVAGPPVYRLTPAPAKKESLGGATRFTFGAVKKLHGVPYADLVAEVPTQGWTPLRTSVAPGPALTAATPTWPAKAPAVRERVRQIIAAHSSPSARLHALHGWVHRTIRYAGRMGSRDGTLKVLKRGFGQCGDSADMMITLARAAGLPARLVAGWIVGGGGHLWAEVHIVGTGWVSVDATTPWIGVSGDYVPLMISESGPMPLMHLRIPKIERIR